MSDTKNTLTLTLKHLASALRNAEMYPEGHPAIHTPLRNLAQQLALVLQNRDRVILGLIDDVLVLDEMPFYDAETQFRAVVQSIHNRKIESITFQPGVTLSDLECLLSVLTHKDEEVSSEDLAASKNLEHIVVKSSVEDEDDPQAKARATYHESLGIVVDLISELRMGKIPTAQKATTVIDTMKDLILTDSSALLGLTMLKNYDEYTYNHSVNVAIFSLAFARHQGVEGEALRKVGLAGLMHDLGKVRTAEDIIKKPGALTDDEIKVMQEHPEKGFEILKEMAGMDAETGEIVLHHHIRFDGTGYPQLPPSKEIHPHGTVVAIADCYDALTTTRPYQKSRHPSEAVRVMRRLSGKAYSPETVETFVSMLGAYPVGELVRLSSNELAVVTNLNQLDATRPRVRLVTNRDGSLLTEFADCDLATESDGKGRAIVAPVNPVTKGIDITKVLDL